jgi:hypothetical protein
MMQINIPENIQCLPEIKRLASELNSTITEAVGCVLLLAIWGKEYAPDGELTCGGKYDERDIVNASGYSPYDDTYIHMFVDAMKTSHIIDYDMRWLPSWGIDGKSEPKTSSRKPATKKKKQDEPEQMTMQEASDDIVAALNEKYKKG